MRQMKLKHDIKLAIITGILVTLIWCCYVTFIYMDSTEESMKGERCIEPMNAQTKVCPPNGYNPKVYTNFGWMN